MAVLDHPLERSRPKTKAKVKGSMRLGTVLLVGASLVAVISFLRVVQTSDAATSAFAIQDLEQEKLRVQAEVHQLEAEIGHLQSLSRIEEEARARGLVRPAIRDTVMVPVPWSGADKSHLPTRYALDEEAKVEGQGSSWWRDLLDLLPF